MKPGTEISPKPSLKRNLKVVGIILGVWIIITVPSLILFMWSIKDDPRLNAGYDQIPGDVMGLSVVQVEELYEEPSERGMRLFSNWDYVYFLGPDDCLYSVDSKWLLINVDDDLMVYEAEVACD